MTRTTALFDRGPAEEFLLARGADQRPHPGGTLYEHLLRVADLLAEWGADRHLQAAGLCHACYGTDGYDQPLLALAERPVLAALIGARAESLVYLYDSCDRTAVYPLLAGPGPVPFRDRFTGRTVTSPEPDICAFTELTAANELDIMRHNPAMAAQHGSALLQLFTRARARLTEAAWQAWEQLSAGETPSVQGDRELRHPPGAPSNPAGDLQLRGANRVRRRQPPRRFRPAGHLPPCGLRRWREAVARYLRLRPGMRLLDLGAGTGMWATAFTSWYRIDVIAVEPSEAMRPVAVHPHRPARHRPRTRLLGFYGVGPDTAAALLLIAVGDHPERLRSTAAWAHMCAVVPIPASSAARCKEA